MRGRELLLRSDQNMKGNQECPDWATPKTGYGAFESATPKKGYGAFFLIGLVGEGVQKGRLRGEIGASISRL